MIKIKEGSVFKYVVETACGKVELANVLNSLNESGFLVSHIFLLNPNNTSDAPKFQIIANGYQKEG